MFKKNTGSDVGALIKFLPMPTALLSSDGKILSYNQQLAELVGEKISSVKFLDQIFESDPARFSSEVTKLKDGNVDRANFEAKISGDKTAKVVITRLEEGFLVNLFDTQQQRELELKLNQSQKMQAVGQLAGGIAHDFNNLLTAMTGFCDLLLQRHPPGDKSFPDIMQIKQNVNRAANLVRQLLAFSRKQVLKPKVIDVTDVLSELSNLLRRLLGEKIRFEMRHGRDLWKVLADPGQIDQVTINLAVNARDAMPQGGVLVIETDNVEINDTNKVPADFYTPETEERIQPGEYVLMRVADTGTGMSREIMGKIFEPFFSTKEVGAGTGLGLATVYGIVRQTGGHIFVKSEMGHGTEFRIYLKKCSDAQAAAAESLASTDSSKPNADLTGKGRILLVEDEVPVRIFAARALTNKGYEVFEADNAETALEQLEKLEGNIDLIVSDVIMPGMNGPEMVREIQKTRPNIKVIFISGYTQDAFEDFGTKPEDLHFLPKPFNLKELAQMVKDVITS